MAEFIRFQSRGFEVLLNVNMIATIQIDRAKSYVQIRTQPNEKAQTKFVLQGTNALDVIAQLDRIAEPE